MLGILVLRLRTERGGHYSMFPGKLLHGALFRCIAAYDATFAAELHARKMKPFTIGFFGAPAKTTQPFSAHRSSTNRTTQRGRNCCCG